MTGISDTELSILEREEASAENYGLLGSDDASTSRPVMSTRWPTTDPEKGSSQFTSGTVASFRKCCTSLRISRLLLGVSTLIFAILFFISLTPNTRVKIVTKVIEHFSTDSYPFAGPFSRFPRISALPPEQRRITLIAVWNDDKLPTTLRHFFYTAQLNADTVDLLMINHLQRPDSKCLNFEKAGVDITWGGNIKYHCMDDDEWKTRHIDFMCGQQHGWNCNSTQYAEVTKEFRRYNDDINVTWRPFLGYAMRDLFANPQNPFWAYIDQDLFIGNFARYPMNLLSQLSIMTGMHDQSNGVYLAGQLTAYNFDDPHLATAWKLWPALKTPEHFTQHLEGAFPQSLDERYWSYAYMRSMNDLPGSLLSWCILPDMNGDDYFDQRWGKRNAETVYVVSGRDILLVSSKYTRQQIEELIRMEREKPIDDLGGVGWTSGEDGSQYLLDQPTLTAEEVHEMALRDVAADPSKVMREGLIEGVEVINGSSRKAYTQYIHGNPLSGTSPPLVRTSLIRFSEMVPGYIMRRIERDDRHRGYERKLLRHHLRSKRMEWFELPPFDITKNMVLRYNNDIIEVFRMGAATRNETLWLRKNTQVGRI